MFRSSLGAPIAQVSDLQANRGTGAGARCAASERRVLATARRPAELPQAPGPPVGAKPRLVRLICCRFARVSNSPAQRRVSLAVVSPWVGPSTLVNHLLVGLRG